MDQIVFSPNTTLRSTASKAITGVAKKEGNTPGREGFYVLEMETMPGDRSQAEAPPAGPQPFPLSVSRRLVPRLALVSPERDEAPSLNKRTT